MEITKEFWNERYKSGETGWDLGAVSPPLQKYTDGITNKDLRILIPGCGNAYEAEHLIESGFTNVFIIDISELAVESFKKRYPQFPETHIFCSDFFSHNSTYDLILEQTFFCALSPNLRESYVLKMHELLAKDGRLVGLLFDDVLNVDKPPFGGNREEYTKLFENYFIFDTFETAYNSIEQRTNRELFINFRKK